MTAFEMYRDATYTVVCEDIRDGQVVSSEDIVSAYGAWERMVKHACFLNNVAGRKGKREYSIRYTTQEIDEDGPYEDTVYLGPEIINDLWRRISK